LVGIVTDVMPGQLENAAFNTLATVVEMTMSPLQHALDGYVLFTQPVVTKLHENCTSEYTLTAILAGTYRLAVVPVLQGASEADPNANSPIAVTLVGMLMLDRLVQDWNAPMPISMTLVGMSMLDRLVHK
jgi:hypothetical protein